MTKIPEKYLESILLLNSLTDKHKEIIFYVCLGHPTTSILDIMAIEYNTYRAHLATIRSRLKVSRSPGLTLTKDIACAYFIHLNNVYEFLERYAYPDLRTPYLDERLWSDLSKHKDALTN